MHNECHVLGMYRKTKNSEKRKSYSSDVGNFLEYLGQKVIWNMRHLVGKTQTFGPEIFGPECVNSIPPIYPSTPQRHSFYTGNGIIYRAFSVPVPSHLTPLKSVFLLNRTLSNHTPLPCTATLSFRV